MVRRDDSMAARQEIQPVALRLQSFAGMQEQQRRTVAAFLKF
jgi:hypothetical protein